MHVSTFFQIIFATLVAKHTHNHPNNHHSLTNHQHNLQQNHRNNNSNPYNHYPHHSHNLPTPPKSRRHLAKFKLKLTNTHHWPP